MLISLPFEQQQAAWESKKAVKWDKHADFTAFRAAASSLGRQKGSAAFLVSRLHCLFSFH